jgi:hypothetical protein
MYIVSAIMSLLRLATIIPPEAYNCAVPRGSYIDSCRYTQLEIAPSGVDKAIECKFSAVCRWIDKDNTYVEWVPNTIYYSSGPKGIELSNIDGFLTEVKADKVEPTEPAMNTYHRFELLG